MTTKQENIFCVLGPTCSGKTSLAFEIIDNLIGDIDCEIVSVDSAMIYKDMNIGTATPSEVELQQYPHHLINICDPGESYSAAKFYNDVKKSIANIKSRNKTPILVGGTALYFKVLQHGINLMPNSDYKIREYLYEEMESKGVTELHEKLQLVDKLYANKISKYDKQRVIRALEVYMISGKPLSYFHSFPKHRSDYCFKNILILPEREYLRGQISIRFKSMLKNGFLEEVENLLRKYNLTQENQSIRCVGYRQAFLHLTGKQSYADMIEDSVNATRQLAKRQNTWFKNWDNVLSFSSIDSASINKTLQIIRKVI